MKHISPDALRRADTPASASSAFRDELLECEPALRRYAGKLGGAELADDLLQATLERALTREAAYTAQGAMTAWLRQIMKNIALTQRKSNRNRREFIPIFSECAHVTMDDGETEEFTATDETTLPGKREAQLDAKRHIELAAKVLGPEMWRCLELTAQGFTSIETAGQLGISAEAVRKNVERGRKAMEALISEPKRNASKSIRKKSR